MDSRMMSLILVVVFFVGAVFAVPYMEALTDSNDVDAYIPVETYDDQQAADRYFTFPQKRNCKRRGQRCQYWGDNECCNGQCKCNIWGQNCKCSRPGLFTGAAWGR